MKIALAACDYNGCGYYRVITPGHELYRRGHVVAFVSNEAAETAMTSDVIIIQRQYNQRALDAVRVARSRGVVTIMELDDSFHVVPAHNPNSSSFGTGKPLTVMVEKICREVDALIVSTPRLQEEYRRFNPNIHLACNAIEDAQLEKYATEITGLPKREGQIRISFAGSDTHRGDFQMIVPALIRLLAEYPEVLIVFVGADMRNFFPFAIRHRTEYAGATANGGFAGVGTAMKIEGGVPGWIDVFMDDFRFGRTLDGKNASRSNLATHKYYDLIRKSDFDIMIAPIESNTFNACKSYLKLEEAGMHCVPIIASNFGEYRRYQKEASEPVCILADGVKEWYRALVSLITSPGRRAALATANLEYVRREHLISKKIVQWENALQDVVRLRDSRKSEMVAV